MTESTLVRKIRLALGRGRFRIFRNNVGQAFFPTSAAARVKVQAMLRRGELRRIKFGLCEGSSDLIGLASVEVTPDMVGTTVAIFVAVEAKDEKTGRLSPAQHEFLTMVSYMGGRAGIAVSVEQAEAIAKGK